MAHVCRPPTPHIATTGWAIPADVRTRFGDGTSLLARYATIFRAVEISSTFYRPHRPATFARWAATVPDDFRFALKVPKTVTHEKRLHAAGDDLAAFLAQSAALGEKRAVLLVQLPPKLAYDAAVVRMFFTTLREQYAGAVVCEPRHASWWTGDADALLASFDVVCAAADPATVPAAAYPGGSRAFAYYRLHGSPQIYRSSYDDAAIASHAQRLRAGDWCVFDNTQAGAAMRNALALRDAIGARLS